MPPFRFVSRTVPRLVESYSYDAATGPKTRAQQYELSHKDAEFLASDARTLRGMPVNINHRPGASVGKVLKAWVDKGAMYHLGTVDDEAIKKEMRGGNLRNVSLFHVRKPLSNVELTLCALKGSRDDSGVIEIFDDVDNAALRTKIPALVAASDEELSGSACPADPDVESERVHYSRFAALVAATDTEVVALAPLYTDATQHAVLGMTSSTESMSQLPPLPLTTPAVAPPAVQEESKQQVTFQRADGTQVSFDKRTPTAEEEEAKQHRVCDELEVKLEKFEKEGVVPDDAKPDDTYEQYLMRKFGDVRIMSNAMRKRMMEQNVKQLQAAAERAEELAQLKQAHTQQAQVFSNTMTSVLNKHGHKMPLAPKFGEVEQARAMNDTQRMLTWSQGLAAATDNEVLRNDMEVQRYRAQKEAEDARARASQLQIRAEAEKRATQEAAALTARMDAMYQQQRQQRPASGSYTPTQTQAQAPPQPQQTVDPRLLRPRMLSADKYFNPHDPHREAKMQQLLRHASVPGMPGMVLMPSRQEYAKANGIAAPAQEKGVHAPRQLYTPGVFVAASDEEILSSGDTGLAAAYFNPMAVCLDKAAMHAQASNLPLHPSTATRKVWVGPGMNVPRELHDRIYNARSYQSDAPDPMRHAKETMRRSLNATLDDPSSRWPEYCFSTWQGKDKEARRRY